MKPEDFTENGKTTSLRVWELLTALNPGELTSMREMAEMLPGVGKSSISAVLCRLSTRSEPMIVLSYKIHRHYIYRRTEHPGPDDFRTKILRRLFTRHETRAKKQRLLLCPEAHDGRYLTSIGW